MPPTLAAARRAAPSLQFLKEASVSPATGPWVPGGGDDQQKTGEIVANMLREIEEGREQAVLKYAIMRNVYAQASLHNFHMKVHAII